MRITLDPPEVALIIQAMERATWDSPDVPDVYRLRYRIITCARLHGEWPDTEVVA